jgi:hypothetical protein
MSNKCEGTCCAEEFGGHEREGREVYVEGPDGKDWGRFVYCDEAIASDRSRGFVVRDDSAVGRRLSGLIQSDAMYRRFKYSRLYRLLGGAWGYDPE